MGVEWSLVIFSLLAGCGGCTFAYAAFSEFTNSGENVRFSVTLAAFILTLIGGLASVTHLASPQNIMAAVTNLASFSGISIELILIGITLLLMLIYLIVVKRSGAAAVRKVIGTLGILAGLSLAFFTGHGYVLMAQPAWNTQALPLVYLGTALAAGAFVYATLARIQKVEAEELDKMALPIGIGALLGVLSILTYIIVIGPGLAAGEALLFWGGLIFCGCIVTALCALAVILKKAFGNPLIVSLIGLIASLVGALSIRILMWFLGSGLQLFDAASGPRFIIGD
jgi:anaerobic dimethyl sulfoxide reductase subunit C (anchor subunit)